MNPNPENDILQQAQKLNQAVLNIKQPSDIDTTLASNLLLEAF